MKIVIPGFWASLTTAICHYARFHPFITFIIVAEVAFFVYTALIPEKIK